jgi:tetratricopeptide (TPR) repeat protein
VNEAGRRGPVSVGLVLALALAAGLYAEDKWYELYQGALKSISSRKWADAEKKLKGAMAAGPPAGRQVRMYGVRFIDYLPEYHLGLVYFNQQRYADALEQFAKVQAGGHVSRADPEFPALTDMLELCRIRTAGKPVDGQKEGEALVRFARDLMGRGNLEEARRALDSAAAKNPGGPDVGSAREELVRLETERRMRAEQERAAAADARREEVERAVESAGKALQAGKYEEARLLLARVPPGTAADARVKELRAETDFRHGVADVSALIAAEKWDAAEERRRRLAVAMPGRAELAELAARIERGLASRSGPRAPVRDARGVGAAPERSAFEAFYSGDYAAAAERFETLARKTAPAERERLVAYAACSVAAAALLKGKDGQAELDRARKLYADAGAAASRLIARDGLVSPRVVRALTEAVFQP